MLNYQAPDDLLDKRIILITGAANGIGRTCAIHCAQHGATVILLDKAIKQLEQVYDEIEATGGAGAVIYPMDLATASSDDFQQLASSIQEEFGHLDGLLHNAAALGDICPIEHYNIQTWHSVIQINLNAAFMLTQACLPLLRQAKQAALIFTSADEGQQAKAFWGAYGVSKFALEGLMRTLAEEFENHDTIRVNSINPGVVRTDLRSMACPGENMDELKSPEELMPIYLYLLGNVNHKVHGKSLDLFSKW